MDDRAISHRRRVAIAISLLVSILPVVLSPAVANAAEQARGTTWLQPYSGAGTQQLTAISCPTTDSCVTAGTATLAASGTATTTNGGTSWHRYPLVPSVGSIDALSCPTMGFCLAVGGYAEPTLETQNVYSSSNLGRTWTYVSQINQGDYLPTVSCASASLCLATYDGGSPIDQSTDGGRTWSNPTLPVPAGDTATPTWVSCASSTECFVVGNMTTPAMTVSVAVWRRVGATFSRVLTTPGAGLEDLISCTTAGTCGVVEATPSTNVFLATSTSGSSWSQTNVPSAGDAIYDVGCAVQTCTVLGTNAAGIPVAESTSTGGFTWSTSTVTTRPGLHFGPPTLSCPSASECFAAGVGFAGIVYKHVDSTASWTSMSAAVGPSPLDAIGCSGSACVAVGGATTLRSTNHGVTWTSTFAGLASGRNLDAAACLSATTCLLGGQHSGSPLLYRSTDAGSTWDSVAVPAGAAPITHVACATTTFCVATGGTSGILVSINGGAAWFKKTYPGGWDSPTLTSTSCVASSCMAVGATAAATPIDVVISSATLAWVSHTFSTFSGPTSVSCESATTCFAIGIELDTGPGGLVAGTYKTVNTGATWTLLNEPPTGQPGLILCAASTCHNVGTGLFRFPVVDQLATSTNSAATWSGDAWPSGIQVFGLARSSGHWLGVGESALGGPEIILK